MTNKLLALHNDLLYPAFAGAALFEFADNLARNGFAWSDLLWAASGSWFLFYFSAAFLTLKEARKEKFGLPSFVANWVEIGIILFVCVSVEPESSRSIHYDRVYWSWVLIPITGGTSNFCSDRPVRTLLSLGTIGIGLLSRYVWSWSDGAYEWELLFMYVLLALYLLAVFERCGLNVMFLDLDSAKWNRRMRQRFGFAFSPPYCGQHGARSPQDR
jgi:hypothetical protein